MHLIPLPGASLETSPTSCLPLTALAGRHVTIEERIDGADAEIAFDARGALSLTTHGRPLAGGFGERSFIPMKIWAMAHEPRLLARLDDRLELRGAWAYAARRIWYDRLPHYFVATDVLDRATGRCLSTARRLALLADSPTLSVPVVYVGPMPTQPQWLEALTRRSLARSADWRRAFEAAACREALPAELWLSQAARVPSPAQLIVKVEDERHVLASYRLESGPVSTGVSKRVMPLSGPLSGPLPGLLPNALAKGADLFAPRPTVTWHDLGLRTLRSQGALRALSIEAAEPRYA